MRQASMVQARGLRMRRQRLRGAFAPLIGGSMLSALLSLLAIVPAHALIQNASTTPGSAHDAAEELAEIMVETREPRFVAPTLRDQIGRIWAPVYINGRGPFRLVLDTGASHSGVTAMVALALGLPTDQLPPIMPDALGGAQGVLGSEDLANKRIFIDFRHDQIRITYSHGERAGRGFSEIPFHSMKGQLIVVDAVVGRVHAKGIIDTGGQTTIGNLALRRALASSTIFGFHSRPDTVQGATLDI